MIRRRAPLVALAASALVLAMAPAANAAPYPGDVNGDGVVNFADLEAHAAATDDPTLDAIVANWGTVAPESEDIAFAVDGLTVTATLSPELATYNNYRIWSGNGNERRAWAPSPEATFTYPEAGTYTVKFDGAKGGKHTLGFVTAEVTVGAPVEEPEPPVEEPEPPVTGPGLPYGADSFFQSRVDGPGVPIDASLTASFSAFMASHPDQGGKGIHHPKVNLNPGWSGHNHVSAASDPIWKLAGTNSGISNSRLGILKTQGVHLADDTWATVPTGDQDRLLVVQDGTFGYTMQCADVVPNYATRTFAASNCGIMWHSSNGLDYRNPESDDDRNFASRGRILDAMQVPRSELDAAAAEGRGLGRVMHLFFVETDSAAGFVHPMVGDESGKAGWGAEGVRLRIKPSVDLEARGLTGAALAIARTLQENGTYLGDNSGSSTQLKIGPPEDYVGTNLSTDVFKGKLDWRTDFEVVQPGWQ